jgi:hypothetical protein
VSELARDEDRLVAARAGGDASSFLGNAPAQGEVDESDPDYAKGGDATKYLRQQFGWQNSPEFHASQAGKDYRTGLKAEQLRTRGFGQAFDDQYIPSGARMKGKALYNWPELLLSQSKADTKAKRDARMVQTYKDRKSMLKAGSQSKWWWSPSRRNATRNQYTRALAELRAGSPTEANYSALANRGGKKQSLAELKRAAGGWFSRTRFTSNGRKYQAAKAALQAGETQSEALRPFLRRMPVTAARMRSADPRASVAEALMSGEASGSGGRNLGDGFGTREIQDLLAPSVASESVAGGEPSFMAGTFNEPNGAGAPQDGAPEVEGVWASRFGLARGRQQASLLAGDPAPLVSQGDSASSPAPQPPIMPVVSAPFEDDAQSVKSGDDDQGSEDDRYDPELLNRYIRDDVSVESKDDGE